jgi:hypothetical protein
MYVYPGFVRLRGKFELVFFAKLTRILMMNGFDNARLNSRCLSDGFNIAEWSFESAAMSVEAADILADYFEDIRHPYLVTRICVPHCGDEQFLSVPPEQDRL